MRAWQFSTTSGGLEKNLQLNTSAKAPTAKPTEHLVRVVAVSLNVSPSYSYPSFCRLTPLTQPVDYKIAEVALADRFIIKKPATPCMNFAGRIVQPASNSPLQPGQLIFGNAATVPIAAGALAEYAAVPSTTTASVPDGVSATDAAALPIVGLTAYQSLFPIVGENSRVFINGGSGGTGTLGIQMAKAAGAHVTTTCSTANVKLCTSLGADEVIDYRRESVLERLQALAGKSGPYNHVVDNAGADESLYWQAHTYTVPGAKFISVASTPSVSYALFATKAKLIPSFLGGGKRKLEDIFAQWNPEHMAKIFGWMKEGKVRVIIDEVFEFERAVEAFEKLKTGRAKGKILIEVPESRESKE